MYILVYAYIYLYKYIFLPFLLAGAGRCRRARPAAPPPTSSPRRRLLLLLLLVVCILLLLQIIIIIIRTIMFDIIIVITIIVITIICRRPRGSKGVFSHPRVPEKGSTRRRGVHARAARKHMRILARKVPYLEQLPEHQDLPASPRTKNLDLRRV